MKVVLALVIAALAAVGYFWFTSKPVTLTLAKPVVALGQSSPVAVEVSAPSGIKNFVATIEQDGKSQTIFEDKSKSKQTSRIVSFDAGKKQVPSLHDGNATLTIEAKSNDFRGQKATIRKDLHVILRPPSVVADGAQHYINQGGAELVTFDVAGQWTDAGVTVGRYRVSSFPMPGQPDRSNKRFSLFAYPWDVPQDATPLVFAQNLAGTQVTATFWTKIFPKKFHASTIPLKDQDLQKFVNELDPEGNGDLVTRFVKINNEMRRKNNQQLYEMRKQTAMKMLWSGAFERLAAKTESYFADQRTYMYKGKKIDQQVHLGFDLAGTAHMPVHASNSGKVIWADRLGIYGNCIVLDHGYSLQTLYGHMSQLQVKVGDNVEKGQTIGFSGITGLALGDHLHFSMLVGGYQINPIEWWDEHWIKDRILSKIGGVH